MPFTKGHPSYITEKTKKKMSETHKRLGTKPPLGVPWNKGLKGIINKGSFKKGHKDLVPKESRKRAGEKHKGKKHFLGKHHTKKSRFKISENLKGEKSYRWKGGITKENIKIRQGIQYRLWRESVFARDSWLCQICKKKGGELHADHIKMFAYHPDLRFAIDNGRTLCKKCHLKLSTSKESKHVCC